MHYIKVGEKNAEEVKKKLIRSMLFDKQRNAKHSQSYVYFPILISRITNKKLLEGVEFSIVNEKDEKRGELQSYREMLQKILTKREFDEVTKSYDLLGNIAIIDLPESLKKRENAVAKILMTIHPSVKTVVAKGGAVSGKFRTRKFRHVLGKRNFVSTYKENGCAFKFDIRKTFFSNRLATERSRISDLVKNNENVMVLFAGVGPFAIEIAKRHPKTKVVAVELNAYACKSMTENLKMNKTSNVMAVNADVRKLPAKYRHFADRIIVPMPTTGTEFLDEVTDAAKKKATVHLYTFGKIESAFDDTAKILREHAKKNNYAIKVIFKRVVRPYSAKEIEIVLDYRITKH